MIQEKKCPECGFLTIEDFCLNCGADLSVKENMNKFCPGCKSSVLPGRRFCPACNYDFYGGTDGRKNIPQIQYSIIIPKAKENPSQKTFLPVAVLTVLIIAVSVFIIFRHLFPSYQSASQVSSIDMEIFVENSISEELPSRIVYTPVDINFKTVYTDRGEHLETENITYTGVYIMNLDGTDKRRLASPCSSYKPFSNSINGIFDVQFSPDGKQVSFVKEDKLWVVGADGKHKYKLFDASRGQRNWITYKWSPDSKKIACISNGKLYMIDSDGNNPAQIYFGAEIIKYDWSSDGNILVYADACKGEVFLKDVSGRETPESFNIPLASPRLSDNGLQTLKESIERISFSFDNSKIAVTVWSQLDSSLSLYMIDMNSGRVDFITRDRGGIAEYDSTVSWSPVENLFLYLHPETRFCMCYKDSHLTELSPVSYQPEFSPGGSKVLFYTYDKGIGIYDFNNHNAGYLNEEVLPVKNFQLSPWCRDGNFQWSSDGQKISFAEWWQPSMRGPTSKVESSGITRAGGVYICNIDGSNLCRLPLDCEVTWYDIYW